jgi:predicted Zn-ribbon and HTH transcriptional regulator
MLVGLQRPHEKACPIGDSHANNNLKRKPSVCWVCGITGYKNIESFSKIPYTKSKKGL